MARAARRDLDDARDVMADALGCQPGEISADGEVTIEFVECLASCGSGPVVLIDDDLHEKVDAAKVQQLSDQIKAAAKARPAP